MKTTLYLCGAGNLEGIRLALRINKEHARWEKIILLDDDPAKHGQSVHGLEVAGPFKLLDKVDLTSAEVANLVGRTTKKRKLARQKIEKYGLSFASLIDPSVDVGGIEYCNDITVYQNAIFAAGAFVDEASVVFMGAIVGHGCRLGKGCVIAPGAIINARVQLGDGVYVGTNASVLPDLKIGPWATIGINSAVVDDVPAGASVMGVPAQIVMTSEAARNREFPPVPKRREPAIEKGAAHPKESIEQALTELWGQVLGIEQIGLHDNFFDLGGDSILAIQIVGKANQVGIQLTIRQLLDHQTIAELASVTSRAEVVSGDQELVTGSVSLTPIQKWLLEQDLPELHHYNQTMLLMVPKGTDIDLLESATGDMVKHHDALRMRFAQTQEGWQQTCDDYDGDIPFSRIDLSDKSQEERQAVLRSTTSKYQASLDLSGGPIFRAVYFNFGNAQPGRLLLLIHHLAVDGISWRILLEDLQTVYQQLIDGEPPKLPPKTTSFQQWAEKLTEYARSVSLSSELDYWLSKDGKDTSPIPRDFPGGVNTEASTQVITTTLTRDETKVLLQKVPATYDTQINDVLLTALVHSTSKWTGESKLLVELEGHGREEVIKDVGVSRTIGWFTSIFPVVLEAGSNRADGATLKTVKAQLQNIPNHGIGYGLLRYTRGDADLTRRLKALPQAEIQFNYLGQFDQMFTGSSMFEEAPEPPGAFARVASPMQPRPYLLEILGMVVNDELRMTWLYSENMHKRSTIESLASDFIKCLRTLISDSSEKEVPEHTSPDSPRASLDHKGRRRLTGIVRYFTADDIPQVVGLHMKQFPWSAHVPPDEQAAKFRELSFHSPLHDDDLPSLVYENGRGRIAGFLGVMPRRMRVEGKIVRVALSHRLMVDPEAKAALASVELLKKFLAGPQDLSIADGATDTSRRLWEGLGGTTSPMYSIDWKRPLRPSSFLAHHMGKKRLMLPITMVAKLIAPMLDAVAVKLPTSPFRQSACDYLEEDLTPEMLIHCIQEFSDEGWLCPDYDVQTLQWLFSLIAHSKVFGELRKSVVRNREGKIIGWYMYHLKLGGNSEVLQVGATEHSAPEVLRCLYYDAWKGGAVELSGRIEPRFMKEFSRSFCFVVPGRNWALIHSRDPQLLGLVQRGEMMLSRLDGEPYWAI